MGRKQILSQMSMSKKIPLQAFRVEGNGLMQVLQTPVVVIPELNATEMRLRDVLSKCLTNGSL